MANNYTQFSEQLKLETEEQKTWIAEFITKVAEHADEEGEPLDFEYAIEDGGVWFHSGESGNPERVADVVQAFLEKFYPDGKTTFTLTWADTCSKPRLGEFGGGWVTVSAKGCKGSNTWAAAEEAAKKMVEGQQNG